MDRDGRRLSPTVLQAQGVMATQIHPRRAVGQEHQSAPTHGSILHWVATLVVASEVLLKCKDNRLTAFSWIGQS